LLVVFFFFLRKKWRELGCGGRGIERGVGGGGGGGGRRVLR